MKNGVVPALGNVVVERASVLICMGCQEGTAVVEVTTDGHNYRGIHWWPPPSAMNLDPSIPDDLRLAYDEGMRCLAVQCPHAAVVMFRRLLEGIVADRGSEAARAAAAKALARGLRVMADEHVLESGLADWAQEIRIVGNTGAHYDALAIVTLDEARDLSDLARRMLEYIYELPARIQRGRANRAQLPNA
jgi:hypothetical protein